MTAPDSLVQAVQELLKEDDYGASASTTFSNKESSSPLTVDDVRQAVKSIRKYRAKPVLRFTKRFPFLTRCYVIPNATTA